MFAKAVIDYKLLTIFAKNSFVDVLCGSKYASVKITLHLAVFRRTFLRFYLKKNEVLNVFVKDKP